MSDKDLVVANTEHAFALLPESTLRTELETIRRWQNIVKELLVDKLDYGVIPGCGDKPTLLKPGAEKLAKLHQLADTYELLKEIEDLDKPMFYYYYRCTLTHIPSGKIISQGIGSCNSKESKYGARWVGAKELPEGTKKEDFKMKFRNGKFGPYPVYMVANDDIFSQVNTLQKMAKKRSFLDATLSACRLSAIFTQDIEDIGVPDVIDEVPEEPKKDAPTVESVTKKEEPKATPVDPNAPVLLSEKQLGFIHTQLSKKKVPDEVFKSYLKEKYKIESSKDILKKSVNDILDWITKYVAE